MEAQNVQKYMAAGTVFTPGSPVNERDLFAGRIPQLQKIIDATSQRGYHAVLYGERGVGKTSLANVLVETLRHASKAYLIAKINCDAGDTFSSIWQKAFKDISYNQTTQGIGFSSESQIISTPVSAQLPPVVQPDDIRRLLTNLSIQVPVLLVLDEYDRIMDRQVATLVSDTIKSLSDFGVNASILIIGVAETIDELIEGHLSIERALVQIPMPRMSPEEIRTIFDKGLERLGMTIQAGARNHLVHLAQGLPYIAHLLALNSSRSALKQDSLLITFEHAKMGITESLEQWQQSIKQCYYDAVKSQQPGNIYKEVLLACAMCDTDELGYFSAASVRTPLRAITGRELDIPNFSRHLKEFSLENRGKIISRVGDARKLRYRFASPIMRPYVIMRGYAEKLIS